MSNHCCNHSEVKIQKITLDDGRMAERHISFDEAGNEIIEIFAEEKRPLKLEKRVQREFKTVVAKETHETIRDGEITLAEVHAVTPDVPLRLVERLGVAEHAKVVNGDYVSKDEISKIVAESVVAGVSAMMENMEPMAHHAQGTYVAHHQPVVTAQSIVEQNVANKKGGDTMINVIMGVILLAQLGFFGYMWFVM